EGIRGKVVRWPRRGRKHVPELQGRAGRVRITGSHVPGVWPGLSSLSRVCGRSGARRAASLCGPPPFPRRRDQGKRHRPLRPLLPPHSRPPSGFASLRSASPLRLPGPGLHRVPSATPGAGTRGDPSSQARGGERGRPERDPAPPSAPLAAGGVCHASSALKARPPSPEVGGQSGSGGVPVLPGCATSAEAVAGPLAGRGRGRAPWRTGRGVSGGLGSRGRGCSARGLRRAGPSRAPEPLVSPGGAAGAEGGRRDADSPPRPSCAPGPAIGASGPPHVRAPSPGGGRRSGSPRGRAGCGGLGPALLSLGCRPTCGAAAPRQCCSERPRRVTASQRGPTPGRRPPRAVRARAPAPAAAPGLSAGRREPRGSAGAEQGPRPPSRGLRACGPRLRLSLLAAQSPAAVEEILDRENKRMADSLASKVTRLKSLALDIDRDAEDQNRYLDSMDSDFTSMTGLLTGSVKRFSTMARSGRDNRKLLCGMALGLIVVFFILSYLLSRART
uniref:BET1-like protein n=2 Tax=Canis lupus familiaris TaxID=9615 RepID=A0A8C0TEM6_CANLF